MDQSFSLSLNGSCGDAQPATSPDLDDVMISVVISNNGIATTVSKDNNNWYNYKNKEWANVVLVNSSSRNKYLNTSGVEVNEDDILAYYVWIPRYSYRIPTVDAPTIKGNNVSLTNQNISTQFATSQKLGTSTYGSTSKVDSHMMKNSEWGAVAYLSHSKYGTNKEIRINNYRNNSKTLTGCGANTENESSSNTCGIIYGKATSYPQSTTGNITGIFDMPGGAWEYVMGYYSGASTTWGATSRSNYAGFSSKLDDKYYDDYTTTTPLTACNGGICYGHGLSEVNKWYGYDAVFVNAKYPWFLRGGSYGNGAGADAFNFNNDSGDANGDSYGFRVVLSFIEAL